MKKLLIVKHLKKEDEASPEFTYLLSVCVGQAGKLFNTNLVTWRQPEPEPVLAEADYVLLLSDKNTCITEKSLAKMANTVNDFTGIVLPHYLSGYEIVLRRSVYTQKDYEEIEAKIFNDMDKPSFHNMRHLPISMMKYKFFLELVNKHSFEQVMTNENLLEISSLNTKIVHCGIFHEFIDYYAEPRKDVFPYLPETIEDVLEIGCGRGVTGKLIQDHFGCRVTGVELNPEVITDAENNLWKVIHGDIQEIDVPGKYDVVLATELFEHLNYPEKFITKMLKVLKPNGRIVLSTPNVGHYSIIEDLIEGRWDYVAIGLLCYTHFRFFTQSTLQDWFDRLGLKHYEIFPQKTELPDKFGRLPNANLESLSTKGFYVVIENR